MLQVKTNGQADLFALAKQAANGTKPKKKDDKTEVVLTEQEFPGISEKLKALIELRGSIAEAEAELKMLEGEVKEIGKEKFIELVEKNKSYPGSFRIAGEKGGAILFMPMDKYISVDENKAEIIRRELGEEIVTAETKFIFNPELLQKYSGVLSELILNTDEIAEEDKPRLIQAETKFSVAKGTIERLYVMFAGQLQKAVSLIQPIFAIKTAVKS